MTFFKRVSFYFTNARGVGKRENESRASSLILPVYPLYIYLTVLILKRGKISLVQWSTFLSIQFFFFCCPSFSLLKHKFVHKVHVCCCVFCLCVCVCCFLSNAILFFFFFVLVEFLFVFTQQTQPYLCTTWTFAHDTLTVFLLFIIYSLTGWQNWHSPL